MPGSKARDTMSRANRRRSVSKSQRQKGNETTNRSSNLPRVDLQRSKLWAPFILWNTAISLVAVAVLIGAELNPQWRIPLGLIGAAGVLFAVPITHFVGGYWRHGGRGWHVWQPFRGGRVFVALQASAWILFTLTLLPWFLPVLFSPLFRLSPKPSNHPLLLPHGVLLFIGACGFLSEALMVASLMYFAPEAKKKKKRSSSPTPPSLAAFKSEQLRSVWSRDDLAAMASPSSEASSDSEGGEGGGGGNKAVPPLPPPNYKAFRVLVVVNLLVTTVSCALAAACDLWLHWVMEDPDSSSSGSGGMFKEGLAEGVSSAVSAAAHGARANALVASCAVGCAASLCVVTCLTHGLGGWWSWGHREWKFWQPFDGGSLFVIIQAIAWSLFGVTLLSFGLAAYGAVFVAWHVRGLVASASFSGLVSQVLLVLSLLFFRGRLRAPVSPPQEASGLGVNGAPELARRLKSEGGSDGQDNKRGAAAAAPASPETGKTLPASGEISPPLPPIQTKSGGPGQPSTPMLQELTKDEKPPASPKTGEALGMGAGRVEDSGGGGEFASFCAMPEDWSPRMVRAAVGGPFSVAEPRFGEVVRWGCSRAKSFGTLILLYAPHHIFWTIPVATVVLLPLRTAGALFVFVVAVYLPWYIGSPHKDGSRHWPAVRAHFTEILEEAYTHHFGGLQIIRESPEPPPATNRYVFGYHPHGLYPATMAWFTSSSAWKRLMPAVNPVVLVATVIFRVPVLREINLWQGAREVSRAVFAQSLASHGSVMLCPGGQSELVHHCCGDRQKVILCARKTGFVRLALEGGAHLVPVFCFGENRCLENIFDWPAIQRFTYKRLGFPIPFLPVGMWGWTPIPLQRPLAIVIGKPVVPPPCATPGAPTPEEVEAVRRMYFEELRGLFERHKARHGCADIDIVLRD